MSWRPAGRGFGGYNPFRVGAMRQRINIQTATDAVDSAGQPIRTWANTYTNEPAEITPFLEHERLSDGQVEPTVEVIFTIHRRDSITPLMRVVYDSVNYGITRVQAVEGGRRYIQLWCKAIP